MFLFRYFLMFLMFSFTGWLIEVIYVYKDQKILVNRGFLFGPYCPIYGFGFILISIFLNKYYNYPTVVFMESLFICLILEYITSYILEMLFNEKWWDYTNRKYNINGRVCLETLIPFGVFSLLTLYVFKPLFLSIICLLDNNIIIVMSCLLFIMYVVDSISTIYIKNKLKKINYRYKENKLLKREINEINRNNKQLYQRVNRDDF